MGQGTITTIDGSQETDPIIGIPTGQWEYSGTITVRTTDSTEAFSFSGQTLSRGGRDVSGDPKVLNGKTVTFNEGAGNTATGIVITN